MRSSDWSSDVCSSDLLTRGEALQPGLFDRADVDEDIFAAIVAGDEAEAFCRVEEFHRAIALPDDLRRHAAAARCAEAATPATIAAAEAATTIPARSEEHTAALQAHMRISSAVF